VLAGASPTGRRGNTICNSRGQIPDSGSGIPLVFLNYAPAPASVLRPLLCLQGPPGPFQSVWPAAQKEVTESHQPFCVGAGFEALATPGMPERRLGETGI
jgi:hypothetical protein